MSIDNIDFLQSYARVFCGDSKRSWHGTTIQAVQPKLATEADTHVQYTSTLQTQTPIQSVSECSQNTHTTDINEIRQPVCSHSGLHRRKRSEATPYTSPHGKSLFPKTQRRARSIMESLRSTDTQEAHEPDHVQEAPTPSFFRQPTTHLSVTDFNVSPIEKHNLDTLRLELYIYLWLKLSYLDKHDTAFVGYQEYFSLSKPKSGKKSNIVYFDVLDAIADNKETVLHVLYKLKQQFIEGHGQQWLVVAGDAKLYDVLQTIKCEYGEEFHWLICYPGDWHMLANYQKALLKPYFDVGLRELAKTIGYPTAALQACSQFKRTHCFITEVWEAIFQVMLQIYLNSASTYPVAESLKQKLFDNHSPQEIETTIASLQMCLSPDHNNFIEFLKNKSQTSNNWKFWSQFVLQDGLAYVGMYLAIRGGNWNLRLACMKLMVPLFCAYDHMTYKRLISRQICDVLNLPTTILQSLSEGGFVASITGAQWHSVAIDEAHEMLINKSCKMSVVHPTEDYIHRISNYMPYRSKCLEKARN